GESVPPEQGAAAHGADQCVQLAECEHGYVMDDSIGCGVQAGDGDSPGAHFRVDRRLRFLTPPVGSNQEGPGPGRVLTWTTIRPAGQTPGGARVRLQQIATPSSASNRLSSRQFSPYRRPPSVILWGIQRAVRRGATCDCVSPAGVPSVRSGRTAISLPGAER